MNNHSHKLFHKISRIDRQTMEYQSHMFLSPAKTGRPRDEDRKIINGIIYVLTTGCRWDDMPKKYGDDSTANKRLNRWQQKGIWKNILKSVINSAHSSGKDQFTKNIR